MSGPRAVAAALAVVAILAVTPTVSPAAPKLAAAPSFSLPGQKGTVTLESFKGKVVLVDFWASWCGPCRGSFPWMASLQKKYGAQGLAIVAINLDKDRPLADEFLAKFPAPFTVAFDPAGKTAEAYRVGVMPTSFLVGRDGRVIETHTGFDPKKAPAFEARIQEALQP